MSVTKKEIAEIKKLSNGLVRPIGRDYANVAIVGKRRRGKSTLARVHVERIYKGFQEAGRNRKILIVDQAPATAFKDIPAFVSVADLERNLRMRQDDGRKWLDGIRKMNQLPLTDFKQLFTVLTKYFRNGVIVWDEANQYLETQGSLPDWQMPLFTTNGNLAVDNYIMLHRLFDIPKSLRGHFDHYCSFATEDAITSPKDLAKNGFPGPHDKLFELITRVRDVVMAEESPIKYHEWFITN